MQFEQPSLAGLRALCKRLPRSDRGFLKRRDFEDMIRTAVSMDGDYDALTYIAGSMTEKHYSVSVPLVLLSDGVIRFDNLEEFGDELKESMYIR